MIRPGQWILCIDARPPIAIYDNGDRLVEGEVYFASAIQAVVNRCHHCGGVWVVDLADAGLSWCAHRFEPIAGRELAEHQLTRQAELEPA